MKCCIEIKGQAVIARPSYFEVYFSLSNMQYPILSNTSAKQMIPKAISHMSMYLLYVISAVNPIQMYMLPYIIPIFPP
jgi:hypothetical protein